MHFFYVFLAVIIKLFLYKLCFVKIKTSLNNCIKYLFYFDGYFKNNHSKIKLIYKNKKKEAN